MTNAMKLKLCESIDIAACHKITEEIAAMIIKFDKIKTSNLKTQTKKCNEYNETGQQKI